MPTQTQGKRIIGVLSGRGGVGKSVLTANMGAVLTKDNLKNILVDADLSNPCLNLHLGLSYSQVGLQDVLQGKKTYGDVALIQPQTGMRVIPASLKFTRGASLKRLAPVLSDISKSYDYTIVDSPPGISEDVFHIINACNEIVVVTTPDVPGVSAATKMVALCKQQDKRVLGVVVNRCTGARYELTSREIENMTEAQVLARVPEDKAIPESISVKTPAVIYAPNSRASKKLRLISEEIIGPVHRMEAGDTSFFSGIFFFLRNLWPF
ncbi:MAG: MinD/ParA family protein [Candidatus Micrarchaeota archaeon]